MISGDLGSSCENLMHRNFHKAFEKTIVSGAQSCDMPMTDCKISVSQLCKCWDLLAKAVSEASTRLTCDQIISLSESAGSSEHGEELPLNINMSPQTLALQGSKEG